MGGQAVGQAIGGQGVQLGQPSVRQVAGQTVGEAIGQAISGEEGQPTQNSIGQSAGQDGQHGQASTPLQAGQPLRSGTPSNGFRRLQAGKPWQSAPSKTL